MPVSHKKKVPFDRVDGVDATLIRGHAAWNVAHLSPDWLAYVAQTNEGKRYSPAVKNAPPYEFPAMRGRYDFSFVESVRFQFGLDYGSGKLTFKYSRDLVTWKFFNGLDGPTIQQNQTNNVSMLYATAWTPIALDAKADVWVGIWVVGNSASGLIQLKHAALWAR